MDIIVVYEEDHGAILFTQNLTTAIKMLIKEGWVDSGTELSTPFGHMPIDAWFGENWMNELIEDPNVLERYCSFSFYEAHLYLEEEEK